MQLLVHGLNHRSAPLELRERVAFLPEEAARALAQLVCHESIAEAALLSTCNRTEFYLLTGDPEDALARTIEVVLGTKGVDLREGGITYTHRDRECVEHLLRVAGGIDSMVIGENGILGQVKTAFEWAGTAETLGVVFGRLFPAALRAGKRSRTETAIGRGAVSFEKAGVQLANKIFGDLDRRACLVIGAGVTGTRITEHLRQSGAREITFANRTVSRAESLAERHGGRAVGMDALATEIPRADIVVSAVNAGSPVVSHALVERAVHQRGRRPLLLVDLGVPRNVEPSVERITSVFLYAIDDLEELVQVNLGRRRQEIPAVEKIVGEEVDRFFGWMESLATAPVVVALRDEVDRLRRESLSRFKGDLSTEDRELLERFSVSFMKRVLHSPTTTVRRLDPASHVGLSQLEWTKRIFGLDPPTSNGADPEDPK